MDEYNKTLFENGNYYYDHKDYYLAIKYYRQIYDCDNKF